MRECPICGKPLGRNKYACSMACFSELKSNSKVCIVCGTKFPSPKSSLTKTCGQECSSEHRKQLAAAGVNSAALEKAHDMAAKSPLTGRFDTHMHAKEWVIQAPDGEVYKCRNLKNWLREHSDMLDGTVAQAWDGISKIKYSMQGKRKRPVSQWKGWRLLEYGD